MTWINLLGLLINGLVEGLIVTLPALALTLVMGVNRFANAATGDFMTVGAYITLAAQALFGLPLWQAAIGGAICAALVSALSYQCVFRKLAGRSMVAPLLASIGLGFLLRSLVGFTAGQDQHTFNIPLTRAWNFGGVRILPNDVVIAVTAVACLAVVFTLLYRSSFGRQLRAIADSPDLARASGIRAHGLMLSLWLLVGALSAIGGVLLGMKAVVMPELGWESLLPGFAAMVLGGIGSPVGAVLGALLMCVVQELSVPLVGPSYKLALSFVILALVLLFRPSGIIGRRQLVR